MVGRNNMFGYVQVVVLLKAILLNHLLEGQTCDPGWFGESCMYKCRCDNVDENCLMDGTCSSGCIQGYFGPGCQYGDLMQTPISSTTEMYLRDNNHSTCNNNSHATSVEVFLNQYISFAWFRLYVRNTLNILGFTTLLNGMTPCTNERRFPMDNYVDVICDNVILINRVTFAGPLAPDVCTIYYPAGRNIALRQNASMPSTRHEAAHSYVASNAVDGFLSQDRSQNACAYTSNNDKPSYWEVNLIRPATVYSVVLINWMYYRSLLNGFSLVGVTPYGTEAFFYMDNNTEDQNVLEAIIDSRTQIKSLRVYKNATGDPYGELIICEVEIFGETVCPENKYGLWCDKTCMCSSNSVCNLVSGQCEKGCRPGKYGIYCSERCSEGCVDGLCSSRLGKCRCTPGYMGDYCRTVCDFGLFGDACMKSCNRQCTKLCNNETRTCECLSLDDGSECTECPEGFFGENCTYECPTSCSSEWGCNKTTGVCLACEYKNMKGENCTECVKGKFGEACSDDCSTFCSSELGCNKTTGVCLACQNENMIGDFCSNCIRGYSGADCMDACPEYCDAKGCNKTTGMCLECDNDDKTGRFCDECALGYYGDNCTMVCPHNCVTKGCDITTGDCVACNYDQQTGGACPECVPGMFGENCTKHCSNFCSDAGCQKMTGDCMACKDEKRTGTICQDCKGNVFGPNCSEICPNSCMNGTCDQITGLCHSCAKGFSGTFCTAKTVAASSGSEDTTSDVNTTSIISGIGLLFIATALMITTVVLVKKRHSAPADDAHN